MPSMANPKAWYSFWSWSPRSRGPSDLQRGGLRPPSADRRSSLSGLPRVKEQAQNSAWGMTMQRLRYQRGVLMVCCQTLGVYCVGPVVWWASCVCAPSLFQPES